MPSNIHDSNNNKKYAEQDKKKHEEQRKQGMSFSEDEIIVENGNIVSISNRPIATISLEALKSFARKLRLKVRSNITKSSLCKELANYKELEPQMEMIVQSITGATVQKNGTNNKNCVLPSNLQHVNGTIFCAILTILDSENREAYLGTGQQIDRGALGAGEGHFTNYAFLCAAYNDKSHDKYDTIGLDTLQHQDIYVCYACDDDVSSVFDELNTNQFTQVLKFINKKYRQAWINNEKSGTHDDFHMFIMGLPWILFYHDQMKELGDFSTTYSTLAYPCLPEDVFLTSDGSSNSSSTNSNKKIKIKIGHKN
mmetsp:Transcript_11616/g.21720  ORF Transcript_11616/g.21720 Transcript_11616/m.21720 type:complete len:311 (-) Transcript_11616:411-1343(-)